jgi:hypothetical protein
MAIRNIYNETISDPPLSGWTTGHVTLYLEGPDERVPVEAWIRGPFAIHELKNGLANVTHIPTGRRVCSFDNKIQAAEFAERIEPLGDWGSIYKKEPPGSELYKKILPIIDEYEYKALLA